MAKEIVWSDLAVSDLHLLVLYLQEHWSERVLMHFYTMLQESLKRIQENPKQFPFINKSRRYRRCVLTRQNTIYYKEFEGHIVLLRIFDTRRNPGKSRIR